MAIRRQRITMEQMAGFLTRLASLPIEAALQTSADLLKLPALAQVYGLTNYDAAYLSLARQLGLPLATSDSHLRNAATSAGVRIA